MERQIIMLGTGSALPESNYNACFVIRTPMFTLLSDTGGGNGILSQLKAAGIETSEITHLVLSHTHTDHIFGAVWLIRVLIHHHLNGDNIVPLQVYANRPTADALIEICRLTYLESYFSKIYSAIDLHVIDPPAAITIEGNEVSFFDVGSENVSQMGFKIAFDDNVTLVSLGDEALTRSNIHEANGEAYLICGAFCRYADRSIFKPYEKHHFTVKDVAELASEAAVKNLVLYHSEDKTSDKRQKYTAEASKYYNGHIIIPQDLDVIPF